MTLTVVMEFGMDAVTDKQKERRERVTHLTAKHGKSVLSSVRHVHSYRLSVSDLALAFVQKRRCPEQLALGPLAPSISSSTISSIDLEPNSQAWRRFLPRSENILTGSFYP
jgi:hypothetical protein